ncbi:MAG: transporter [Chlorobium sp.]
MLTLLKKSRGIGAWLLLYSNAFATHPLVTDDTTTQGARQFQLEVNSEFSNDQQSMNGVTTKESTSSFATALTVGISENLDITLAVPWQWNSRQDNDLTTMSVNGVNDITFGLKWRFLTTEDGITLALKPVVSLPTGDSGRGFGRGKLSEGVTAIATHQGRLGALHCNLGYTHSPNINEESSNNIWHASFASELNLSNNLRSVFDFGIDRTETRVSTTHPSYSLGGFIYSVSDNLDLDLGLKNGHTETTILAGITTRF